MSEKLVIISDMGGSKRGLWITSYLGYLQQYFDITYHDSQKLANLNVTVNTKDNIHRAFTEGGIDTAVAHLLKKEEEPAHYLGFSTGGTIAWKAGLMGLPMKSLYTVSATRIRAEVNKPECDVTAIFGDNDMYRPKADWYDKQDLSSDIVKGFGHEMYTDEKIIDKICLELLKSVTQKPAMNTLSKIQVA
jgi:dienelactone hydrolase